ncbi:alpha/beta hydrolase [Nocardia sp. NPDC088792]|uniref:alpha/beta hydrolase n=1 Tax=Nocardia sp. NPDC088792 TaxID=3364332 RepID=UPI0037F20A11
MITEELFITAGAHTLAATEVLTDNNRPPRIVYLHGLGPTATRHGIRYLLDELAESGYGSLTFEFSGNGDSTGILAESTLAGRRAEALAAVAHLDESVPPVLIATSMGAHLAACIVPEVRPRALILFVPAAYPAGAEHHPFDGTQARPGNYADSPAFAGLAEFDGDLLIVAGTNDQVARPEVVDGYLAHAGRARSVQVLWFDCDHFIHRWLPGHDLARAEVCQAILAVLATAPSVALQKGSSSW